DDGSTDDTIARLESYRGRISFLRQSNRGPGAARNLGAQHSKSEYVAFLDSDDLWFQWTLATYAMVIEEQKSPNMVAGALVHFRAPTELSAVHRQQVELEAFADYFAASRRSLYCGSGQMVVRRRAFLEAGGFAPERINAEDHDLAMRLGIAPGFVNVLSPS